MIPGLRGFYEGTDKEGRAWRIPRHVDPDLDGLRLAAKHPRIFDKGEADTVPLAEFDRRIEEVVPDEVIGRIEHVIKAGKFLHSLGLADAPPLEEREWRRGMLLSWSHARDLEVVHDAIGHPRLLANRHDLDEVVLAKHLKQRLSGADTWYRNYVESLDEGAWVNVGFFNPHLSASLYKWGDDKAGAQNAMDAHRLAAHHQGSAEEPLDWVERAINFIVHHIPREHWGIRHEPRGSYDDLEERLATDPAIKDASIGKEIARDAAKLYERLEEEGMVVPWRQLQVPVGVITASELEHAFLVTQPGVVEEVDAPEGIEPRRLARARELLGRLPEEIGRARSAGRGDLAEAYQRFLDERG